ncbi:MAG TPA: hypothetical protein VJ827_13190 [Rubrobacter sp.]|nr:hypothetical protein [Rubrobacter sp.]
MIRMEMLVGYERRLEGPGHAHPRLQGWVLPRWCALAEGEVKQPGIWLAEEVVLPGSFFERLASRGLVPTLEATLEGSHIVQHGKDGK